MFRFEPSRLDGMIDRALNAAVGREDLDVPYPDSAGPGFRLGEVFTASSGTDYGPRGRVLDAFVYGVFVGGGGPAQSSCKVPGKPVLFAQGHRWPVDRDPFLAVSAGNTRILVPLPEISEPLLDGPRFDTVGQARQALHDAVRRCVDRVNLVWPAAVALDHEVGGA